MMALREQKNDALTPLRTPQPERVPKEPSCVVQIVKLSQLMPILHIIIYVEVPCLVTS